MAKQSKRQKALTAIDRERFYPVDEAVRIVKANATAKFDETVEVAMNLGVDPRHADQMVRGVVSLPAGTGKTVRVTVFARGGKADEAREAGADVVGAEDLMETIQGGTIDFDRVIATPDMMGIVGRLGKVLGPKGLMPSPKAGTVTADVATAVREYAAGKIEFRNDAGGNVHSVVGKVSFDKQKLADNINAMVGQIRKMKPATSKGAYLKKVVLKSSMSPAVPLAIA